MSFRLDWESLRDAYRQSYHLAKTNPDSYREMSQRARERMQGYAAPEMAAEQLRRFFFPDAATTADRSQGHHSTEDTTGRR